MQFKAAVHHFFLICFEWLLLLLKLHCSHCILPSFYVLLYFYFPLLLLVLDISLTGISCSIIVMRLATGFILQPIFSISRCLKCCALDFLLFSLCSSPPGTFRLKYAPPSESLDSTDWHFLWQENAVSHGDIRTFKYKTETSSCC